MSAAAILERCGFASAEEVAAVAARHSARVQPKVHQHIALEGPILSARIVSAIEKAKAAAAGEEAT